MRRVWRAGCPREHSGSPVTSAREPHVQIRPAVRGWGHADTPRSLLVQEQDIRPPRARGLLRHCPHPPQRSEGHAQGHIVLYTPGVFTFLTEKHSSSRQKTVGKQTSHAFKWMLKNDQTALSKGETQLWIRRAREWLPKPAHQSTLCSIIIGVLHAGCTV